MEKLIVGKTVKTLTGDLRISGELVAALELKVRDILKQAGDRAIANNRKTIMPVDL